MDKGLKVLKSGSRLTALLAGLMCSSAVCILLIVIFTLCILSEYLSQTDYQIISKIIHPTVAFVGSYTAGKVASDKWTYIGFWGVYVILVVSASCLVCEGLTIAVLLNLLFGGVGAVVAYVLAHQRKLQFKQRSRRAHR